MSWSMKAAHTSSRSIGSPSCSPASASWSKSPSARRPTCSMCLASTGKRAARFVTLARRTSSKSGGGGGGGVGGGEVGLEEDALAHARLGDLDAVDPRRLHDPADHHRAGKHDVRPGGL